MARNECFASVGATDEYIIIKMFANNESSYWVVLHTHSDSKQLSWECRLRYGSECRYLTKSTVFYLVKCVLFAKKIITRDLRTR